MKRSDLKELIKEVIQEEKKKIKILVGPVWKESRSWFEKIIYNHFADYNAFDIKYDNKSYATITVERAAQVLIKKLIKKGKEQDYSWNPRIIK